MDKLDDVVILNPDYHFKNDKDRIVMYSKKKVSFDSSIEWIGYIHPMQAMILGLFTTPQSLALHCKEIEEYFKLASDDVKNLIMPYVNNPTPIYVTIGEEKVLFPKNVLIPYHTVDNKNLKYDFKLEDLKCSTVCLSQERMHKAPHSLLFMLTNKCVTKCKYCYADCKTTYVPLTTEQILSIIEKAHDLKVAYIDVIGGEVFCRKDWDVIISKLVEYNMTPNYISTKVPITQSIIKKLCKTGYNNVIQLSLDSLCEPVLKEMIGCNNGYIKRIQNGIELLQSYGYEIQIDTILSRINCDKKQLLELYSYLKNIRNLKYWEIRIPEVSIYTPDTFASIKASREQLIEICEFIKEEIIPKAKFKVYLSSEALDEKFHIGEIEDECFNGGSCGILNNRLFVLPDGKVSICEQLYWHEQFIIGDLRKQSLEEVWNSDKAFDLFNMHRKLFEKESPCAKCKIIDSCNQKHRRCFVKTMKAYGYNKWNYPDPRCRFAPPFNTDLKY